jgi:hypothetical protein
MTSRRHKLPACRPLPPPPAPVNGPDEVVRVLSGPDGFRAFCTVCLADVTPTLWARATVQASIADRILHLRHCAHQTERTD